MKHLASKFGYAITAICVFAGGEGLLAQNSSRNTGNLEVSQDFLLWKKSLEYRTEVKVDLRMTNTKIHLSLSNGPNKPEREARGAQDTSFFYKGAMAYTTLLGRDSNYNGSAERNYERCTIEHAETYPLKIDVDAGFWEVWVARIGDWIGRGLPKEWEPHVEVVERKADPFGGSLIIVRQKPGSPSLLGGRELENGFQSMGELQGKAFLLEWPRMETIRRGALSISPVEPIPGGGLRKTGGQVSPIVQDVIKRESSLLYLALLGFDGNRKDGDVWVVDGQALDAMVHPAVEGSFEGKAVVRAASVSAEEPPNRLVGAMTGLKLRFEPSGFVDGMLRHTDLTFVVKTVDGSEHRTKLNPADKSFAGEIWVDTENQCPRYGELKVDTARYSGFLPKIGDLSAKVKLDADLFFQLNYAQSIAPRK